MFLEGFCKGKGFRVQSSRFTALGKGLDVMFLRFFLCALSACATAMSLRGGGGSRSRGSSSSSSLVVPSCRKRRFLGWRHDTELLYPAADGRLGRQDPALQGRC